MIQRIKQWVGERFGLPATMYQPGTGRIVAADYGSDAGINVTPETAMTIPAIFHGLRLYAQTLGMLKFDLIHHLSEELDGIEHRRQEVARTHPVHVLLNSTPNEFQNPAEWRETLITHAILTGNGYSYIERSSDANNWRPTALLPLLPDQTRPSVTNGRLGYVTVVDGQEIHLDPWEVFHIKGFSWNGRSGIPLWRIMSEALGLDKAQTKFATQFYGNGANMGGIVTMPGAMTDTARQNIKSSMAREYGGLGNAFRTLFLEENMKYEKVGVEPDKAQFIEGRQHALGEMARVIGLQPHLLFDLSRATFSNIEHLGIEAVTYSFRPWANKLEQEANRKLLYQSEQFDFETRIDLKPLMQGDSLSQAQRDQIRFNTLAMTPNEIRAEDGRNPQPGGDTLYLNTALLPLSVAIAKATAVPPAAPPGTIVNVGAGAPVPVPTVTDADGNPLVSDNQAQQDDSADDMDDTPPAQGGGQEPANGEPGPTPPAKLDADYDDPPDRAAIVRPVLRDALARIARREAAAVERALAKHAGDVEGFNTWFAGWQQEQRQVVVDTLQPARDVAAVVRLAVRDDYAQRHLDQTSQDIEQVLQADPISRPDVIAGMLSRWQQERVDDATNYIVGGSNEQQAT